MCLYERTPTKACCHEIFYFSINFSPQNREFPLETTDSFTMTHMHEGSTLYGQGTALVSLPQKRRGDGNSIFPLVGFYLLCHDFCTILAGGSWSWPRRLWGILCWGVTTEGSGEELESRTRSSKILKDDCLFSHLPIMILNKSWEHNCLGKFWMRSVSGRGQAGPGSVRYNSFQFALLHDHCVLSS